MRKYIPIFLDVFTKLRVLTVPDLHAFCEEHSDRKRVYENLSDLIKMDYVVRVRHEKKPIIAYGAAPVLLKKVFADSESRRLKLRPSDLGHSLSCTKVALSLMQYSFVSGIALEHELTPNELNNFCHERRPDGIIQVSRDNLKYEIAIEVETSAKAFGRIENILKSYQITFTQSRYLCAGVIIVAPHEATFKAYQDRIESMPKEVQDRVILENGLELKSLNPKYFGARLKRAIDNPHLPAETIRTNSAAGISYLPMKSVQVVLPDCI